MNKYQETNPPISKNRVILISAKDKKTTSKAVQAKYYKDFAEKSKKIRIAKCYNTPKGIKFDIPTDKNETPFDDILKSVQETMGQSENIDVYEPPAKFSHEGEA